MAQMWKGEGGKDQEPLSLLENQHSLSKQDLTGYIHIPDLGFIIHLRLFMYREIYS